MSDHSWSVFLNAEDQNLSSIDSQEKEVMTNCELQLNISTKPQVTTSHSLGDEEVDIKPIIQDQFLSIGNGSYSDDTIDVKPNIDLLGLGKESSCPYQQIDVLESKPLIQSHGSMEIITNQEESSSHPKVSHIEYTNLISRDRCLKDNESSDILLETEKSNSTNDASASDKCMSSDVIDLTDETIEIQTNVRFGGKKKKKKKKKKKNKDKDRGKNDDEMNQKLSFNGSSIDDFYITENIDYNEDGKKEKKKRREIYVLPVKINNLVIIDNGAVSDSVLHKSVDRTPSNIARPTRIRNLLNYNEDELVQTKLPILDCENCCNVFESREAQSQHLKESCKPIEALFKCDQCSKAFMRDVGLKHHIRKMHEVRNIGPKNISCSLCGHFVWTKEALSKHRTNCSLRITDEKFNYESESKGRARLKREYSCNLCQKKSYSMRNLRQHIETHIEIEECFSGKKQREYSCNLCEKTFPTMSRLYQHRQIHTISEGSEEDGSQNLSYLICPEQGCDQKFQNLTEYKRHARTHSSKKPYPCLQCGKHFSLWPNMLRHMKIHFGIKTYTCDYCDKTFSDSASKTSHTRHIHTKEKPFSCTKCPIAFATKSDLARHHTSKHTDERRYTCPDCGAKFKQRGGLICHLRRKSGEKPWQCGVCKKSFAAKGGLLSHMACHSTKRLYKCGLCDKDFRHHQSLILHMVTHTGVMKYVCKHCTKKFAFQSNRNRHQKICPFSKE